MSPPAFTAPRRRRLVASSLPAMILWLLAACGDDRRPAEGDARLAPATTTATGGETTTGREWVFLGLVANPPVGAPFPLERFDGFLPPQWKLGDRWSVVLMEPTPHRLAAPGSHTLTGDAYDMRVIGVPDAHGKGHYRIEAVDRYSPERRYKLSFSAKNRCLTRVEERRLEEVAVPGPQRFIKKERLKSSERGAVPHVRGFRTIDSRPEDPVLVFPCLPESTSNPWVDYPNRQSEVPTARAETVWQLVEDAGDKLVFGMGEVRFDSIHEEFARIDRVVVEWRRGAPWWTLVKGADKFSLGLFGLDPSMSREEQLFRQYHELADGDLVVGRTLGPDEKRPSREMPAHWYRE